MIRKALTGLGLLALGSYLWIGTSVGSYVRTGFAELTGFVQKQVPIETQLKRARLLLNELIPDITRTKRVIAEEEVKVERLRQDIVQMVQKQENEKVAILALREKLTKNLAAYEDGRNVKGIERELNRRFASYKRGEETLKLKQQVLASRMEGLDAARQKLREMNELRDEYTAHLEALEAQHKMAQVAGLAKGIEIDDTRLSELKGAMEEISIQLEVQRKMAEDADSTFMPATAKEVVPADLGKEIDQYFGKTAATKTTAL